MVPREFLYAILISEMHFLPIFAWATILLSRLRSGVVSLESHPDAHAGLSAPSLCLHELL